MKSTLLTFASLLVLLALPQWSQAQTTWTGPKMTFTKLDSADWNMEANQDRITDSTWITRKHSQGIFNIVQQAGYDSTSPSNTEWGYGTTADLGSITFDSWIKTNGNKPPSMVGKDAVLHLIHEDIFIDIKFLSFSGGANKGGGFSYERSTDPSVSVKDVALDQKTLVFPNPAHDIIHVTTESTGGTYDILDLRGAVVQTGIIQPNSSIKISLLNPGVYILKTETDQPSRFIKN